KLSARLACVARYVPAGSVVADIGADHAYLLVYLLENKIADRALAGEVSGGPYRIALGSVRAAGLEDRIAVRLGNGLQILKPGEADVAVLAGMGGRTICGILNIGRAVLDGLERLILQPMRDVPMVRRWLAANHWRIIDEEMVFEEQHYYVVIVAVRGREEITDHLAFELGPRLLEKRSPVLRRFLLQKKADIAAALSSLQASRGARGLARSARLRWEAEKIEEVLAHWPCGQKI
ncbi:MAG: class I SAM-dependent methyltransferase, partial [Firmicutes bacterium]|nr:class I SAM-dependent methyltransferase [Bacillota bacterium]